MISLIARHSRAVLKLWLSAIALQLFYFQYFRNNGGNSFCLEDTLKTSHQVESFKESWTGVEFTKREFIWTQFLDHVSTTFHFHQEFDFVFWHQVCGSVQSFQHSDKDSEWQVEAHWRRLVARVASRSGHRVTYNVWSRKWNIRVLVSCYGPRGL